jgi:hypothetical protein
VPGILDKRFEDFTYGGFLNKKGIFITLEKEKNYFKNLQVCNRNITSGNCRN